jgi:Flp pilus assembly protein TadD
MSLAGRPARLEALTSALLARFGLRYDEMELGNIRTIESVNGQRFETKYAVAGKTFDYRFQVMQHGGRAWLVAVWTDETAPVDPAPLIEQVFNRFAIDRSAPAVAPADLARRERRAHSRFYNDLGLFHFSARQYADAIDWFRQSFELETNDPGPLENLIVAQLEQSDFREAKEYLSKHLDSFPDHERLRKLYADLQAQTGESDAAVATYAGLFSKGYRDDEAMASYVELLSTANRHEDALAAIDQYLLGGGSPFVRRLQAGLISRRGDHQRAIQLLIDQQKSRPFDPDIAYSLAEVHRAAGQYREGLDVCDQLLAHRYDTADAYLLKAQHELGLKWYAAAKKSLELALARESNDSEAQTLLSRVSAILGEGSNSSIKEPLSPVAIPSELVALPEAAEWEGHRASYGACYLQRITAISFSPGKEHKTTRREVIKVFDTGGVTRFSTFQVEFDPLGEQIFVNSLRITDANGKEVAAGKPEDSYVIDATDGDVATHRKLLNVPAPGLQPGHTVEFTVTSSDFSPPMHCPFFEHDFAGEFPIVKDVVYIAAASSDYAARATEGLSAIAAGSGEAWIVKNPPVLRFEPMQAPLSSFVRHLSVGDSSRTWDAIVREYLETIKDRSTIEPSIRALADQTKSGIENEEDRVRAIARLVQGQLTYKAIEFGSRARVPNSAATVLANKFGDCKDHSLLLMQLLQASGIEAKLALIRTDGEIDESLASLDQFNHMLVYLPEYRGGQFIDCTDKDSPVEDALPPSLAGRRALVLDDAAPRLVTVSNATTGSRVECERSLRIVKDVDLSIDETVRIEGHLAANLRGLLKEVQPANRAAELQKQLGAIAGAPIEVHKVDLENLSDNRKPLVIKITSNAKNSFHTAGNVMVGKIPALWERLFLTAHRVESRQSPFVLRSPLDVKSSIEFALPPGYFAADTGAMNGEETTPFAEWKVSANTEGGALCISYEATRLAGSHKADEYSKYCDSMDRATAALARNLVLHRAGAE